jgi:predicted metalloprotease with PDZ domain
VKTTPAIPRSAALLLLAILLTGAAPTGEPVGLGLSVSISDNGLLVTAVEARSPAEAGGLRPGDVIVGAGAVYTGAPADFRHEVAAHRGNTHLIKVRRAGSVVAVAVSLNPRFRGGEEVLRQCASFCLVPETQRWQECGCVVAECRNCLACSVHR